MLSLVISRECLEGFKLCCEFVVDDQDILIGTRWHVLFAGNLVCDMMQL